MRRFALPLLAVIALATPLPASAYETATFTADALQAAQAAGKPIIVHVTATWCTVCAAQAPIVKDILKDPKYKDLVLFNLDFDDDKKDVRALKVQAQSTFVVFKGKMQVGFSSGDTQEKRIAHIFEKSL